jgi:hypothetical protein
MEDKREPVQEVQDEYEYICRMGCTDGCKAAAKRLEQSLRWKNVRRGLMEDLYGLGTGADIGVDYVLGKIFKGKSKGGVVDMRFSGPKVAKKTNELRNITEAIEEENEIAVVIGAAGIAGIPGADEAGAILALSNASVQALQEARAKEAAWKEYCAEQWAIFWKQHERIKKQKNR